MLDHLDDIESDLSVFHRVDDMWAMDGPRFFRLAVRLPAYEGVVRRRLMADAVEAGPSEQVDDLAAGPGVTVVGSTAAEMAASDLSDFVSFGGG